MCQSLDFSSHPPNNSEAWVLMLPLQRKRVRPLRFPEEPEVAKLVSRNSVLGPSLSGPGPSPYTALPPWEWASWRGSWQQPVGERTPRQPPPHRPLGQIVVLELRRHPCVTSGD